MQLEAMALDSIGGLPISLKQAGENNKGVVF